MFRINSHPSDTIRILKTECLKKQIASNFVRPQIMDILILDRIFLKRSLGLKEGFKPHEGFPIRRFYFQNEI